MARCATESQGGGGVGFENQHSVAHQPGAPKNLSHIVRFDCLVGIQTLKYEFGLFLQLLKIKFDMLIDFAYEFGPGEVFSESANSKRVKSYFKMKNVEK